MTAIKICGITNLEDASNAVACGVDALGFIFYPKSPRYVSPAAAQGIMAALPGSVARVGVFVNQDIAEVQGIAESCRLDLIQLHGDESPAYCRQFAPSMLIKALPVASVDDLQRAGLYPARAILLDTRADDLFGGTGKVSDWGLAAKAAAMYRTILAGGLNEDNVLEAIERVSPAAVDINSGVEVSPGRKDREQMERIVRKIRTYKTPYPERDGIFKGEL